MTIVLAASVAVTTAGVANAQAANPELISIYADGAPIEGDSGWSKISGDGNVVGFQTPEGRNGTLEVYARDRDAHTTTRLDDEPWVDAHTALAISRDGTDLASIKGADDAYTEIFHLDTGERDHGPTWPLIGVSHPSLRYDGATLAFIGADQEAPGGWRTNVYVTNVGSHKSTQVTFGTGISNAVMSSDGKKMAFRAGGHTYIRTIGTREMTLVDVTPDGSVGNASNAKPVKFSHNGKWLLFTSSATDLTPGTAACTDTTVGCAFRYNVDEQKNTLASVLPDGSTSAVYRGAAMSNDGRVTAFDAGDHAQVYARRLSTSDTKLVSDNAAGAPGDSRSTHPDLDDYGSHVTFSSASGNFGRTTNGDQHVWLTTTGF